MAHRRSEILELLSVKYGNYNHELELVRELGHGNYGVVYLARDDRHRDFAVKKVLCNDADAQFNISQELTLLTALKHENIIKLYAVDFIDRHCVFVMEYCANGTLNERLNEPVRKDTQYVWMQHLLGALKYLHSNNVVHRDLKPDNVLLKEEGVIKLADFGVAREFYGLLRGRRKVDTGEYLSEFLNPEEQMGTFAGTPHWVAPELFEHRYDEKADIFSLGIIFVAIMTRNYTIHENKRHYGAFVESYRNRVGVGVAMSQQERQMYPDFGDDCDPDVVDVVKEMLAYNPSDRISIEECLKDINEAQFRSSPKRAQYSQPSNGITPVVDTQQTKYPANFTTPPAQQNNYPETYTTPVAQQKAYPTNYDTPSTHLDIPSSSKTPYSPVSSSDESTTRETASLLQSTSEEQNLMKKPKKEENCCQTCAESCQNCCQTCIESCIQCCNDCFEFCCSCCGKKQKEPFHDDRLSEPFANEMARE